MIMKRIAQTRVALIALVALSTAGCGKGPSREESPSADAGEIPPAVLAVFRKISGEGGALPIREIREKAGAGDRVVIEAAIIGSENPFIERRAAFVIGDPERIETCDELHADSCPTPWDACCEEPDTLRENTAIVQIVDSDGRVLPVGLRGVGGLREQARVRVEGRVANRSGEGALVINADAIQVF